jgi:MSHA biogenesis protein MshE
MLDALRKNDISLFTKVAQASELYLPLSQCALEFALAGKTTLSEVFKITASLDESSISEND